MQRTMLRDSFYESPFIMPIEYFIIDEQVRSYITSNGNIPDLNEKKKETGTFLVDDVLSTNQRELSFFDKKRFIQKCLSNKPPIELTGICDNGVTLLMKAIYFLIIVDVKGDTLEIFNIIFEKVVKEPQYLNRVTKNNVPYTALDMVYYLKDNQTSQEIEDRLLQAGAKRYIEISPDPEATKKIYESRLPITDPLNPHFDPFQDKWGCLIPTTYRKNLAFNTKLQAIDPDNYDKNLEIISSIKSGYSNFPPGFLNIHQKIHNELEIALQGEKEIDLNLLSQCQLLDKLKTTAIQLQVKQSQWEGIPLSDCLLDTQTLGEELYQGKKSFEECIAIIKFEIKFYELINENFSFIAPVFILFEDLHDVYKIMCQCIDKKLKEIKPTLKENYDNNSQNLQMIYLSKIDSERANFFNILNIFQVRMNHEHGFFVFRNPLIKEMILDHVKNHNINENTLNDIYCRLKKVNEVNIKLDLFLQSLEGFLIYAKKEKFVKNSLQTLRSIISKELKIYFSSEIEDADIFLKYITKQISIFRDQWGSGNHSSGLFTNPISRLQNAITSSLNTALEEWLPEPPTVKAPTTTYLNTSNMYSINQLGSTYEKQYDEFLFGIENKVALKKK